MILLIIIVILFVFGFFLLKYRNDKTEKFQNTNQNITQNICYVNIHFPTELLSSDISGCCNNLWKICKIDDVDCEYPVDYGSYIGILRQIQSTKLEPNQKYKVLVMNVDYVKKWLNVKADFIYNPF